MFKSKLFGLKPVLIFFLASTVILPGCDIFEGAESELSGALVKGKLLLDAPQPGKKYVVTFSFQTTMNGGVNFNENNVERTVWGVCGTTAEVPYSIYIPLATIELSRDGTPPLVPPPLPLYLYAYVFVVDEPANEWDWPNTVGDYRGYYGMSDDDDNTGTQDWFNNNTGTDDGRLALAIDTPGETITVNLDLEPVE